MFFYINGLFQNVKEKIGNGWGESVCTSILRDNPDAYDKVNQFAG